MDINDLVKDISNLRLSYKRRIKLEPKIIVFCSRKLIKNSNVLAYHEIRGHSNSETSIMGYPLYKVMTNDFYYMILVDGEVLQKR